jgi:catechol 2,3-dioxygenase-like lactoylglutathione lyase family enzyme
MPTIITTVTPQLRTTDLASSIDFYTRILGFQLEFQYDDFYAGVRVGDHVVHLKQVDDVDPSIPFVEGGEHFHLYIGTDDVGSAAAELKAKGVVVVKDVHDTPWHTREVIIRDDQGHTLYLGQRSSA